MLPMQRITRLPLLVDAVLSKLKPNDDEFDNWKMTLALLNKVNTINIITSFVDGVSRRQSNQTN